MSFLPSLAKARLAPLAAALALSFVAPAALAEEGAKPKLGAARLGAKKIAKAKDPGTIARFPGFEAKDDGGSRIFVDLNRSAVVTDHASGLFLTYSLGDVHIEAGNDKNALETYFHNTPVLRARLRRHKKETVLEIVLRAESTATHRVVETKFGYRLEVDFPPGKFGAQKDRDTPPEGPKRPKEEKKKGKGPTAAAKKPANP